MRRVKQSVYQSRTKQCSLLTLKILFKSNPMVSYNGETATKKPARPIAGRPASVKHTPETKGASLLNRIALFNLIVAVE
jgi:hypothetical protein